MPVMIRAATADDVDALLKLYVQLSPDNAESCPAEVASALNEVLTDPAMRLFVAESNGTVVGTGMAVVVPGLTHSGRPWMQVENMVVDERWRGHGVGRALLDACSEFARVKGCYKVQLQSAQFRAEAHRFYAEYGFTASSVGFRLYLD